MLGTSRELATKFSHKAAQTLSEFSMTFNMATQAVAKANADMANTGTGHAVLKGLHITSLTQDAALDISADTQLGIWVTATAYTTDGGARVDVRYVEDDNGNKEWYKCILAHTSSASTKPGQSPTAGNEWKTYWVKSSNRALPAVGQLCANLKTRHYLCLADVGGVMTTVIADNGLQLDADSEIRIPQYDPEIFIALALLTVDGTGASTWGTTDDNAQVTIVQCLGPVYPTNLGIDAN